MNIPERATASGVIYVTENLVNGKIYVGLDTKKAPGYLGSGVVLQRAIRKYGREAFRRYDVDSFRSAAEGFLREQFWIRKLHSRSDTGWGYNLTDGGEGGTNHTEEARQKMRAAATGKSPSAETRQKLSAALTGRKLTLEHRRKLSESWQGEKNPRFGKSLTEDTKRKISAALTGERNPMFGKVFSDEHRRHISEAVKGKKHPMFGRAHTEEAKRKISIAHRGKKRSEEHKRKMGEARKGKPWSPERHAAWARRVKSAGLENQANA